MERLKKRSQQQQQHFPMQSVMDDMDQNEREALMNGTRKRKAPVNEPSTNLFPNKNLQQKRVNAKKGPKGRGAEDDEEYSDFGD